MVIQIEERCVFFLILSRELLQQGCLCFAKQQRQQPSCQILRLKEETVLLHYTLCSCIILFSCVFGKKVLNLYTIHD